MTEKTMSFRITNVTDLIDRNALRSLLLFCDIEKMPTSDYELFHSLCAVTPLLVGHPLPTRLAFLLDRVFDISLPLNLENCDEIWRRVADFCFAKEMTSLQCEKLLSDWTFDQPVLKEILPSIRARKKESLCLNGEALSHTSTQNWVDWRDEMEKACNRFFSFHSEPVFFSLPATLTKRLPSLYHVERALQATEKREDEQTVLTVQTLRFLCEKCRSIDRGLHLRIECDAGVAVTILKYIKDSVGLPTLVWSTRSESTADAVLGFLASQQVGRTQCALYLSDYPTDAALVQVLEFYAARYPIGRLAILDRIKTISV